MNYFLITLIDFDYHIFGTLFLKLKITYDQSNRKILQTL